MLLPKEDSQMAKELSSVFQCPHPSLVCSEKALEVPDFSGAARPRSSLRYLTVALLGLLGVVVWSCSPSTAGALLAKQAIAPGHRAALSSR